MDATATAGAGAVVRQFYGLLGEGKVEEMLALLHDDAVVRESPSLPYGGDFHGKQGFLELTKQLDQLFETENVGSIEFQEAGNTVVLRMTGRFKGRNSGRVAETPIVELVSVRDGRIADLDVYYKNPSAIASLVGE